MKPAHPLRLAVFNDVLAAAARIAPQPMSAVLRSLSLDALADGHLPFKCDTSARRAL